MTNLSAYSVLTLNRSHCIHTLLDTHCVIGHHKVNCINTGTSQLAKLFIVCFSARQHTCRARYMLQPVRLSVCHTGESVKIG